MTLLFGRKYVKFWILFLIVAFAFVIRVYKLSDIPAGFHGDEAAYGYNAYSLLATGTDEYGKRFPLILKSFEDYKPALYAYLDIPFIKILGLNEFAVRFPSALFGTFTILILYFLTTELFKNRTIGYISSLLLAISPWHIMLSRTTSEVIVSMFFLLVLIFALRKLEKKFSIWWFLLSIVSGFFALGFYTASRFFVLIISGVAIIFSIRKKQKKISLNFPLLAIFILLLCIEVLYNSLSSNRRFDQVNIFSDPTTKIILHEQIAEDAGTPSLITRIFHNKLFNYERTALQNYSQYFTLDFLVLNGGYPKRIKVPWSGVFYLWEIPFLLIGIYYIFRKKVYTGMFFLILWLFLLIPAAITYDDIPNLYRTIVVVPEMIAIISLGLYETYLYIKSRKNAVVLLLFILTTTIFFLYEFFYFSHELFAHQNAYQPWYRNYPSKQLVLSINNYYPMFKKILLTKSQTLSYIHFLFFDKYDPKKYQHSGSNMDKDGTGFDKYIFTTAECPFYSGKNVAFIGDINTLYINSGVCAIPRSNAKILKTIYWGDGTVAFRILQFVLSP